MQTEQVLATSEKVAKILAGNYIWLLIVAIVVLLLRSVIENLVAGFLWRKNFYPDQILYISGRKSRLVRTNPTITFLYV